MSSSSRAVCMLLVSALSCTVCVLDASVRSILASSCLVGSAWSAGAGSRLGQLAGHP